MSNTVTVTLELDTPRVMERFEQRFQQAQRFLDSEVLRSSSPYVPMRTGALMRSGITGTKVGSGKVVYNAPYARTMYYGTHYRFSKDKHPQASAQWFEKAKAVHLDDWLSGAAKIIKDGESR